MVPLATLNLIIDARVYRTTTSLNIHRQGPTHATDPTAVEFFPLRRTLLDDTLELLNASVIVWSCVRLLSNLPEVPFPAVKLGLQGDTEPHILYA